MANLTSNGEEEPEVQPTSAVLLDVAMLNEASTEEGLTSLELMVDAELHVEPEFEELTKDTALPLV